jgi:hypothetical protein
MALFSSMVFGPILAFSAKTVSANLRPHAIRKFPSKTAAFSSFFRQSSFESSIRGHHSNKMKSALFGSVAGEGKGTSIRDSLKEVSESGEFKRKESAWRNWISKGMESKIKLQDTLMRDLTFILLTSSTIFAMCIRGWSSISARGRTLPSLRR